jgi:hypothetical protein
MKHVKFGKKIKWNKRNTLIDNMNKKQAASQAKDPSICAPLHFLQLDFSVLGHGNLRTPVFIVTK